MRTSNRYLQAFKEQFNVVGLASACALSAATLNPLPVLAAVVAEAAYLIFIPDSRWYAARLSRRYDAEVAARRQELKDAVFPQFRAEMQQRFLRLEGMREQINSQPMEGQKWFREVLRKLDYLLEKFLRFASEEVRYRIHLRSLREAAQGTESRETRRGISATSEDDDRRGRRGGGNASRPSPPPSRGEDGGLDLADRWVQQMVQDIQAQYDRDAGRIRKLLEVEQEASTKAILEKRLDVLQRREERLDEFGRILTNLNHQLQLIEDTFGLINDDIRARSPEQVLTDIEDVVWQTESMTKVLDEVAPFEQIMARLER